MATNPRNMAPIAAPATVPLPPKMFTPPTTTAATTASTTPFAEVPLIVPNSITHMTPGDAREQPAQRRTPRTRRRRAGMPRIAAASGLLPTA